MFIYTQVLAEACATEVIVKTMVPVVVTIASDQVANVSFNVAKMLIKLFRRIDDVHVYMYAKQKQLGAVKRGAAK